MRKGDVLYGRLRPYLNKVTLAPTEAYASGEFIVFRDTPEIDGSFLRWRLAAQDFVKFACSLNAGDRPRVKWPQMAAFPLLLPSLPAQRQIVELVEEHLSRLDAASTEVSKARGRLAALRAAALSEARAGQLVALADVCEIQGGVQKQPRRAPSANHFPFLRVANVTSSGLDLREVHRVELFGDELTTLRLRQGDLLVVEGNGSASQIGRAATWDGSLKDCVHQNHLIRVRPGARVLPAYLEVVWNSPESRRELTCLASSSSGLHTLSVSKLKQLRIPVPPLEVQRTLLSRVGDLRFAHTRLSESLEHSASRSAHLRRAVLAAAFEGKLTGRHTDAEVIEELTDNGR